MNNELSFEIIITLCCRRIPPLMLIYCHYRSVCINLSLNKCRFWSNIDISIFRCIARSRLIIVRQYNNSQIPVDVSIDDDISILYNNSVVFFVEVFFFRHSRTRNGDICIFNIFHFFDSFSGWDIFTRSKCCFANLGTHLRKIGCQECFHLKISICFSSTYLSSNDLQTGGNEFFGEWERIRSRKLHFFFWDNKWYYSSCVWIDFCDRFKSMLRTKILIQILTLHRA